MDSKCSGSVVLPIVLVALDQDPSAVVTQLSVQAWVDTGVTSREGITLEIAGEHPWLDPVTARRWREELVTAVQMRLVQLGVTVGRWRVGLRYPDAAALTGQACVLEGCSADAAFFTGLIASATGLRIRRETLLTGGISTQNSGLATVGQLPSKLRAAASHPEIRRFIHAPIETDGSGAWVAEVLQQWDVACANSEHLVQRIVCDDFTTAFKEMIDRDSLVIAAIEQGWLDQNQEVDPTDWGDLLLHVTTDDWQRHLDWRIHNGERGFARRLLDAYIRHALSKDRYPAGLGACLSGSLRTVPAGKRRERLQGKLIQPDLIERCDHIAEPNDRADFELLAAAAVGRMKPAEPTSTTASTFADDATPQDRLDWLLQYRSELPTANRIDCDIDEARLSFRPEATAINNPDSFIDLITAYLAHVKRHAKLATPLSPHLLTAEAVGLVEEAFAREGGSRAAMANALDHTQGGIRGVLDRMTDTLKARYRRADISSAHMLAIDRQDLDASVIQARELLERLGPLLPERFRSLPPEFIVADLEMLVHETVQAGDRLTQLLRNR